MKVNPDYLEIKGDAETIIEFELLFEKLGYTCEKSTSTKLGFMDPSQIVTLLVALIGGGGLDRIITAIRKKKDVIEKDVIEVEVTPGKIKLIIGKVKSKEDFEEIKKLVLGLYKALKLGKEEEEENDS